MPTQYLILIKCSSRLFTCMSLCFIARGYGLAALSARLLRATNLILLADLVKCLVEVSKIASSLPIPPRLCIEIGR